MLIGMVLFHMAGRWPFARREYSRLIVVWLAITGLAFVTGNYWAYVGIVIGILLVAVPRDPSVRLVFFATLLLALPVIQVDIPGIGPVRQIMDMSHPRMLIFGLLVPMLLLPDPRGKRLSLFGSPLDKYVLLFIVVDIIMLSRGIGGTEKIRLASEYMVDFVLVYFIVSRNVRSFDDIGRIMAALLFAAVVLACVAIFESGKAWKLYDAVYPGLNISSGVQGSFYDWRGGFLRTSATTGYPIILGYFFTLALGALMAVKHHVKSSFWFWALVALLLVGNFTTVARGTWLGAGVLVATYLLLTSRAKLFAIATVSLIAISFAGTSSNPAIRDIFELLPFTGSHHDGTIDYRRALLDNAIAVMKDNILLGTPSYLNTSELEQMRQGQGIIDIVNTYVQYGLRGGIVLLGLFMIIFSYLLLRLLLALRHVQGPVKNLCVVLISMIVSHLVMIFTVSSISYLPYLQWILISVSAAFIHLHVTALTSVGQRPPAPRPSQPNRPQRMPGGVQAAHFTNPRR